MLEETVLYNQLCGFDIINAAETGRGRRLGCTINRDITQNDDRITHMGSTGYVDDEAVDPAIEHGRPTFTCAAIDRNRLGDGQGAVAGRIERVDFAALGCLGDCARECLAGSRATAGVYVVTDAGDPGSRGLGV